MTSVSFIRNHGDTPLRPNMILTRRLRPAAEGGDHRESGSVGIRSVIQLGTNLRFLGVDVKTAQELLRHANAKTTLDLYTQAVSRRSVKQAL